MAGKKRKDLGIERKFKKGQKKQRLDDFFHFISFSEKIKPKIIVAENVRGVIFKKAIGIGLYLTVLCKKHRKCVENRLFF